MVSKKLNKLLPLRRRYFLSSSLDAHMCFVCVCVWVLWIDVRNTIIVSKVGNRSSLSLSFPRSECAIIIIISDSCLKPLSRLIARANISAWRWLLGSCGWILPRWILSGTREGPPWRQWPPHRSHTPQSCWTGGVRSSPSARCRLWAAGLRRGPWWIPALPHRSGTWPWRILVARRDGRNRGAPGTRSALVGGWLKSSLCPWNFKIAIGRSKSAFSRTVLLLLSLYFSIVIVSWIFLVSVCRLWWGNFCWLFFPLIDGRFYIVVIIDCKLLFFVFAVSKKRVQSTTFSHTHDKLCLCWRWMAMVSGVEWAIFCSRYPIIPRRSATPTRSSIVVVVVDDVSEVWISCLGTHLQKLRASRRDVEATFGSLDSYKI